MDASVRWRTIRLMTDSCVMAAMMRREPRRQNGRSQGSLRPHSGGRQVAISTSKTRPSNLASANKGFLSSFCRRAHPAGAVWE